MSAPILYTLRRCPFAMRARIALCYAGIEFDPREVNLREKPAHMLEVSPKGTVPILLFEDGTVIDESLDVMLWALAQNDPDGWLDLDEAKRAEMDALIEKAVNPVFKHTYRYKYPERFPEDDVLVNRQIAQDFAAELDQRLSEHKYLIDDQLRLADAAIFPLVRFFARIDPDWFSELPLPHLQAWLQQWYDSDVYEQAMQVYDLFVE